MEMEMKVALNDYLDAICDSYAKSIDNADMIADFESSIRYVVGPRYIKVITGLGSQESAHSFIVRETRFGQFQPGDILKAASWTSPARNFARGNIFEDVSKAANWTGA